MTGNFLHDAPAIALDEAVDTDNPECEVCGTPMWLTKVETKVSPPSIHCTRSFECKSCGSVQRRTEERADPLPNVTV